MEAALERLGLHRRRSSIEPPGTEIQMLKSRNKDEAVEGRDASRKYEGDINCSHAEARIKDICRSTAWQPFKLTKCRSAEAAESLLC